VAAVRDLDLLLASMEPVLHGAEYGYATLPPGAVVPAGLAVFATVAEDEGLTLVALADDLGRAGIACLPGWARISLTVHSDLQAVGLTAAIATALGAIGISANVVAGYYHDHFFVQRARAADAMAALERLRAEAMGRV
jgi:uncharacterized protein